MNAENGAGEKHDIYKLPRHETKFGLIICGATI